MKRTIILLFMIAILLYSCKDTSPAYSIPDVSNSYGSEINPESSLAPESFFQVGEDSSMIESSVSEDSTIPEDTVISFLACPDNLIHPSIYYDAIERASEANGTVPTYSDLHSAEYDFSPIYESVAEAICEADIAYLNQETLIGGDSKKISGYPRFNSPTALGETVVELGFDVVNVAHNHMLDSGNTDYLEYCNSFFEARNVDILGYYPDEESLNNLTIIEAKDIKIAFLSYTYGTNGLDVQSGSECVIPFFDDDLIKKQVALAEKNADFIIVSCHWGYENTYSPNDTQEYYAEFLCELGVDIVLGMHPHCIQPIEWMTSDSGEKTLVVYSLGNFVSGMQRGMNMLAGMLSIDIVKDGETGEITVESPAFIPTVTHYTRGTAVASDDTGYRNYKIYYLDEYTEELADEHAVRRYEKSNGTTLIGGSFSKSTLLQTLYEYIDVEFLPDNYLE